MNEKQKHLQKNLRKQKYFKKAAGIFLAVMLIMSMIPFASAGPSAVTVTYYSNAAQYGTQDLTYGDKASAPVAPAVPAGMVSFVGWSKDQNGMDNLYDFSSPVTGNLNLYAQFSDKHLISFKDADGDIFYTQLVEADDYVVPPPAPPSGTDNVFVYWVINGTNDIYDFSLPVNSNIVLKPIYDNSYYIYFNAMKGTPVDNQLVGENEKVLKPDEPTRVGYEFAYWSKTIDADPKNTALAYDFSSPVSESLTLYAIWKPDEVNKPEVKVIIWKEKENLPIQFDKEDPSNYVYHDSFVTWESAGKTIEITETEMDQEHSYYIPVHSEFYRSVPAIVEGDGSTAVNVYYTSKIYTLYFYLNNSSAVMTDSGKNPVETYTNTTDRDGQYSIDVKINMNIENIWPLNGSNNFNISRTDAYGYSFQGWLIPLGLNDEAGTTTNTVWVSKRQIVTAEMLPDSTYGNGSETQFTLNAYWISNGQNTELKYMFEALPEEEEAFFEEEPTEAYGVDYIEYNGKMYINSTYSQIAISNGSAFKSKSIDGKTALTEYALRYNPFTEELEPISGPCFTQYLIYDRTRYSLDFDTMGGSSIAGETDIMEGETLNRYIPTEPSRTDYVFTGWYEDREYQKPYDLKNAVMPSRNLELFARWEHIGVTATFYDQPAGTVLGIQNVELNESVRPPANGDSYFREIGTAYENAGVFKGWYHTLNNGLVVPYDFTNNIERDFDIYGLYKTAGFKVTYNENGGIGPIPTDSETYKLNALAPVKNAALTKGSLVLAGWQETDKTGIIYYPGSTIKMYGNVSFEAVYADSSSLVNLIYDANYADSTETKTDTVIEGREYALRDNQTFKRSGYVLTGWSEIPGAVTPQYTCGSGFLIPSGGATLYATWEEVQYFTVTFVIRDEDQHKGDIVSQYEFKVEKGAPSVQAIPAAVRPAVDIIPDSNGIIKYRFVGWDALPVTIQQDLIVYGNFEDIKEGGGGGTGTAVIKDKTAENIGGENNTTSNETGYEKPITPGNPIVQTLIVYMFPLAIAVYFFCRMQNRDENEEKGRK